jgi:ABC-2 type transport system permease protein
MAVYKRSYHGYEGGLTGRWQRLLVVPRYAFEEMYSSRFLTLFFLGALMFPLLCGGFIYLHHSLSALKLFNIDLDKLVQIDARWFLFYLGFQSMLAFFLTVFIGPGLISPDLAHNGLTMYLARPFSRADYVISKLSILVILLSAITWVPGLLLFFLQGYLAGTEWIWNNPRIFFGILVGSLVWIFLLSFLALALSAWVKWKPVAGALLFGVFFISTAIGEMINNTLDTWVGNLVNLSHLVGSVWVWLFETPMQRGSGAVFFRVGSHGTETPVYLVWASLAAVFLFCIWLLGKKVRGVEVVK